MTTTTISRRSALAGGGGLLLAASLPLGALARTPVKAAELNAWVRIAPDNVVTLILSQSEMGQGIGTTLPAVLADELGADWERVRIEYAPLAPAYGHPVYHWMFTGNSESIMAYYDVMRTMGAAAREMLIAAAATKLRVPASELAAKAGRIEHSKSRRSVKFGDLATAAARLKPNPKPALKPQAEQMLLGRALPRRDIPAKVDGSAVFGIDVRVPGMLNAAIRMAPAIGATLKSFDAAAIRKQPGVVAVVEVPGGLAVVADTYWKAKTALDGAKLEWSAGTLPGATTETLLAEYAVKLKDGPFAVAKQEGDIDAALKAADETFEQTYTAQFQAHATMEPLNCTAHVTKTSCEISVPTQGVQLTHIAARQVTGLPDDKIKINRTFIGGGFGRKLLVDFVKQTLIVAKQVGRPVKLIWSREDDFAHDFYRPAVVHRIRAGLGDGGLPAAIDHQVVSPSMLAHVFPRGLEGDATARQEPPAAYDLMHVEGLVETPYKVPAYRVRHHRLAHGVPGSVWRTTGHGPNNFAFESFVDELAREARQDPLAYRRALLKDNPRALKLLDLVAAKANWAKPAAPGTGRGLAFAHAFGGLIAQIVELSLKGRDVKLARIVSAVDCGRVLDPAIAARNIEGGIVWGLSALRTQITFADGAPVERNFDTFDPLHLWETPPIEVHFIDSGEKLGGLGEIGPVPTLAAACNAIVAAGGERIRTLPITRSNYRIV